MYREFTKKVLILIFISTFIQAEEKYFYTVSFWKIPCMELTMTLSDESSNHQKELKFRTKTNQIFSLFFPVDNQYRIVYDIETFQMIRYEKEVEQPNVEQEMIIEWDDDENVYQYENTTYERPRGTHNVFSLLMRGRAMDWNEIDTKWWYVDHEGQPFQSRYLWADSVMVELYGREVLADHYRIDFIPAKEEPTQLVEITDVFTWGIALDDCIRQIWIERNGKRRILRAEVKVRGITLVAELK